MKKRVFIVHGWGGNPQEGWFPWLKTELEKQGFEVQVPAMPNADEPEIGAWVAYLSKTVGTPDEQTYFIGHSIGCQIILRYLEQLPATTRVGGAVFVAGWFTLQGLESEEERGVDKPWLETPIDFAKVKQHTDRFFALFSDNDDFVALENKKWFEERLGAQTATESDKGHFSGSDGVTELPIVLEKLSSF